MSRHALGENAPASTAGQPGGHPHGIMATPDRGHVALWVDGEMYRLDIASVDHLAHLLIRAAARAHRSF